MHEKVSRAITVYTVHKSSKRGEMGTFNMRIRTFPGSFIAGNMGFTQRAYFEIADAARQLPLVEF
jgi:hypothetical protein